jgi:serine protease inhibitor
MKSLHLTLASILFLQAAGSIAQQPSPSGGSPMNPDVSTIAKESNAFAVDLYSKLKMTPGNLFFSPASVTSAFAMAYAGARGSTAPEMASTLHFALPPDRLHPAMGALIAQLNGPQNNYELHMANALWAEKDQHFLPDYTSLMKRDYSAGFQPVDFKVNPEAARALINNWVAQQTQQKILDLVPAGSVTPLTRLILTNAIYFKAAWASQFSRSQTQSEDFHLSATKTVKADLMHQAKGGAILPRPCLPGPRAAVQGQRAFHDRSAARRPRRPARARKIPHRPEPRQVDRLPRLSANNHRHLSAIQDHPAV